MAQIWSSSPYVKLIQQPEFQFHNEISQAPHTLRPEYLSLSHLRSSKGTEAQGQHQKNEVSCSVLPGKEEGKGTNLVLWGPFKGPSSIYKGHVN